VAITQSERASVAALREFSLPDPCLFSGDRQPRRLAADQPILLAGTSVAGASSSNSKRRVAYPVAT
jgi:hypothetical protein